MLAGTGVWVLRPGRKRNGAASRRNLMFSPNLEQAKAGSISHPTSIPNFQVLPAGEAALTAASQGPSANGDLRPSPFREGAAEAAEALPRRRKGKVAQLSKEVRDRLNQMLLDGVPYEDIISRLGKKGAALNKVNLHSWFV